MPTLVYRISVASLAHPLGRLILTFVRGSVIHDSLKGLIDHRQRPLEVERSLAGNAKQRSRNAATERSSSHPKSVREGIVP